MTNNTTTNVEKTTDYPRNAWDDMVGNAENQTITIKSKGRRKHRIRISPSSPIDVRDLMRAHGASKEEVAKISQIPVCHAVETESERLERLFNSGSGEPAPVKIQNTRQLEVASV